jgi:hypothetical protein
MAYGIDAFIRGPDPLQSVGLMQRALFLESAVVVLIGFASQAGEVAPSQSSVPGLATEDRFPRACVDCHIVVPDSGMDQRLSTRLRAEQTDPDLLARIRAVLPQTVRITGRHPRLPDPSFRNIPGSCLLCHRDSQTNLPALGPMMHAIHLTGGSQNRYVALFGGACTNCHKFNGANGRWSIPSAPEN